MSIKDNSKIYDITNATTGQVEMRVEHRFFRDFGYVKIDVSVGDIILLHKIKELLFNGYEVHITTGYKSNGSIT